MLPVVLGAASALAGVGGAVASAAATGTFLGLSATTWGIVSAGLTAVSAFTSYQANNQNIDYQIKSLEQSRDIAREQFTLRSQEEHAKTMDELSDAARQARIQAARARVSAGEAGVAGVTVERLMNEQVYEHGLAMAKVEKNADMTRNQLDMELMVELAALAYPGAEREFKDLLERIDRGAPVEV